MEWVGYKHPFCGLMLHLEGRRSLIKLYGLYWCHSTHLLCTGSQERGPASQELSIGYSWSRPTLATLLLDQPHWRHAVQKLTLSLFSRSPVLQYTVMEGTPEACPCPWTGLLWETVSIWSPLRSHGNPHFPLYISFPGPFFLFSSGTTVGYAYFWLQSI